MSLKYQHSSYNSDTTCLVPTNNMKSLVHSVSVCSNKISSDVLKENNNNSIQSQLNLFNPNDVQEPDFNLMDDGCDVNSKLADDGSPLLVKDVKFAIPFGWKRLVQEGKVKYISPSNVELDSMYSIISYIKTEGTCKCGLPCPLKLEEIFSFNSDYNVESISPSNRFKTNSENGCRHESSLSFVNSTACSKPSSILGKSCSGELHRKKSKSRTKPYEGMLVSQLLAKRDKLLKESTSQNIIEATQSFSSSSHFVRNIKSLPDSKNTSKESFSVSTMHQNVISTVFAASDNQVSVSTSYQEPISCVVATSTTKSFPDDCSKIKLTSSSSSNPSSFVRNDSDDSAVSKQSYSSEKKNCSITCVKNLLVEPGRVMQSSSSDLMNKGNRTNELDGVSLETSHSSICIGNVASTNLMNSDERTITSSCACKDIKSSDSLQNSFENKSLSVCSSYSSTQSKSAELSKDTISFVNVSSRVSSVTSESDSSAQVTLITNDQNVSAYSSERGYSTNVHDCSLSTVISKNSSVQIVPQPSCEEILNKCKTRENVAYQSSTEIEPSSEQDPLIVSDNMCNDMSVPNATPSASANSVMDHVNYHSTINLQNNASVMPQPVMPLTSFSNVSMINGAIAPVLPAVGMPPQFVNTQIQQPSTVLQVLNMYTVDAMQRPVIVQNNVNSLHNTLHGSYIHGAYSQLCPQNVNPVASMRVCLQSASADVNGQQQPANLVNCVNLNYQSQSSKYLVQNNSPHVTSMASPNSNGPILISADGLPYPSSDVNTIQNQSLLCQNQCVQQTLCSSNDANHVATFDGSNNLNIIQQPVSTPQIMIPNQTPQLFPILHNPVNVIQKPLIVNHLTDNTQPIFLNSQSSPNNTPTLQALTLLPGGMQPVQNFSIRSLPPQRFCQSNIESQESLPTHVVSPTSSCSTKIPPQQHQQIHLNMNQADLIVSSTVENTSADVNKLPDLPIQNADLINNASIVPKAKAIPVIQANDTSNDNRYIDSEMQPSCHERSYSPMIEGNESKDCLVDRDNNELLLCHNVDPDSTTSIGDEPSSCNAAEVDEDEELKSLDSNFPDSNDCDDCKDLDSVVVGCNVIKDTCCGSNSCCDGRSALENSTLADRACQDCSSDNRNVIECPKNDNAPLLYGIRTADAIAQDKSDNCIMADNASDCSYRYETDEEEASNLSSSTESINPSIIELAKSVPSFESIICVGAEQTCSMNEKKECLDSSSEELIVKNLVGSSSTSKELSDSGIESGQEPPLVFATIADSTQNCPSESVMDLLNGKDVLQGMKKRGTKRRRRELCMLQRNTETFEADSLNSEDDNDVISPFQPRSFNTGDLVWGQIRGFPSWPGKLVSEDQIKGSNRSMETQLGKLWVKWFGDHTCTQVDPDKLKTLSEGLEAHHRARKKHRRGRKMNRNLENAIQEAMQELDKQGI